MSSFFYSKRKEISILLKRFLMLLIAIIVSCFTIINPILIKTTESKLCSYGYAANFPTFKDIIKNLFNKKDKKPVLNEKISVYVGGYPLGFTFNCNGVLVVAISNDSAENLTEGDIIKKIEDYPVSTVEEISEILNNKIKFNDYVSLLILRLEKEERA